jgi:putative endonuclease
MPAFGATVSNLRGVGREAEDRAADFLIANGYTILTRRYTTPFGELDIVALDGETLVFVEVKYRRAAGYVPEEAVGERKLFNLKRATQSYLEKFPQAREWRFDLIAIDGDGLRHYPNSFEE